MKREDRKLENPTPQPEIVVEPKGLSYSRVTPDEQIQILEARLRQLEIEHYQHATNRRLAPENAEVATRWTFVPQ